MIRISVIIVNYNARYFLKNCIYSILSSDMVDELEIIVVDNDSSDGSAEMLRKDFPQVRFLSNKNNLGFSKANNKAVASAKGDYILILNPDTIVKETTLSAIMAHAEQQVHFGAAGVQFIDGAGEFLPESKRNFPNLKVAGAKLLGYAKYYYANHKSKGAVAEIDILTGAFMFIKREVYNEVGGFDEDFFMYGEDIDLSYRIRQAGYVNYYLGTSKVLHFKGESTVKDQVYLRNFYGALSIFYKKHFPNNSGLYVLIDMMIKFIIGIKSLSLPNKSKVTGEINTWAYLGEDLAMFKTLKKKFSGSEAVHVFSVTDKIKDVDIVFFDSADCSFKEILDGISNPLLQNVSKRIISRDRSFYLGSDTSHERGEVVML